MKAGLAEIERHLRKVNESLAELKVAETGSQLRDAWESFLHSFARTIGRLIALGLRYPETKSWAYRLKNASTNDDEGLVFLREARNVAEHGLSPCADFRDRFVDVGGAIAVAGNSSVTFSGNTVNGRPMGDFSLVVRGGRAQRVAGRPSVAVSEQPAKIFLKPVFSEEKHKCFDVPNTLGGRSLDTFKPFDIAIIASEHLDLKVKELREVLS